MNESEQLQPGQLVKIIACTRHNHQGDVCPFIGKKAIAIDELDEDRYDTFILGEWGRKWFAISDLEVLTDGPTQ